MISSVLVVFFVFNLMIFIHEFGHFVTAKMSGMEVKEFAIGFGPKIISHKYRGTIYSLRILPLGGFNDIKIAPEGNESPNDFYNKSFFKRITVLASGSIFNILSAFIALIILFNFYGTPTPTTIIGKIQEDSIASSFFKVDDKIIKINENILDEKNKQKLLSTLDSNTLDITVLRDGEEKNFSITKNESEKLGITFLLEKQTLSFSKSVDASFFTIKHILNLTVDGFKQLFNHKIAATEVVSGPIGTVSMMYKADVEVGFLGTIFMFVIVSLSLGFMNLLPIPILDGGHILIQLIEAISNKKLSERQLKYSNYIGLTIVFSLFCFGTYSDINRFILN